MNTTLQQLRMAERDNNWLKVKLYLIRLGLVKPWGSSTPCPHCGLLDSGVSAWPEDISNVEWNELVSIYIKAYIYRCTNHYTDNGIKEGCGELYLGH